MNQVPFSLCIDSLLTQLTFFLNSFCPSVLSPCFPSESDEGVTSPTSDRAAVAKKRFTLQGFSNLKAQKGNCKPEIFHYPPDMSSSASVKQKRIFPFSVTQYIFV